MTFRFLTKFRATFPLALLLSLFHAVGEAQVDLTIGPSDSRLSLDQLSEFQQTILNVVPKVQACVVSIEGGSGFIVTPSGIVATVGHLSREAGRNIDVRMSDGTIVPGVTIGSNRSSDTGGVKLLGKGPWPYLKIADSKQTQLGDLCLAFGYPLAFPLGKPTAVRLGVITGLSETQMVSDCAIMGGDSGGPLVNVQGEVVGIHLGATSETDKNFHIPMKTFRRDAKAILAGDDVSRKPQLKRTVRPYFGVLGETDENRVRIRNVIVGSPAESAGILANDVILKINDNALDSFSKFLAVVDSCQPGEQVAAQVNRAGEVLNLKITLGKRESASQEFDLALAAQTPSIGLSDKLEPLALDQVTAKPFRSVVQIYDSTQVLTLGTVVSADGLIVTKASELTGDGYHCRFHDGSQASVKVVGISQGHDLAMVQVEMNDHLRSTIQPVTFPRQPFELKAGSIVVSVGIATQPPRLGVIGLDGHGFSIYSQECTDCIELGMTFRPVAFTDQATGAASIGGALVVQKVQPRSIAEQAGLRVGDEIISVNGQNNFIASSPDQIAQSLRPGDEVLIEIRRAGDLRKLKTRVSRFSNHVSQDQWGGGPFSRRRFGFSSVITHDIPISPDQCGSPIVNLSGQVVGINIARSLRVSTLAIPLPHVKKFILGLRPTAELTSMQE